MISGHVRLHRRLQRQIHPQEQQLGGLGVQLLRRADGADPLQKGKGGGDAFPVSSPGVQHLFVQRHGIAHLRDVGALLACRQGLEISHHDLFHALIQIGKAAGPGPVLGDHGGFEPFPVDRLVQIVLDPDLFFAHARMLLSLFAAPVLRRALFVLYSSIEAAGCKGFLPSCAAPVHSTLLQPLKRLKRRSVCSRAVCNFFVCRTPGSHQRPLTRRLPLFRSAVQSIRPTKRSPYRIGRV